MRNRARKSLQGLMFAVLAVMSLQLSAAGPSDGACSAIPAALEPETEADAYDGGNDNCGTDEKLDKVGLSPAHCAALLDAQAQGQTIPAELAEDAKDCKEWPLWTTTNGAVAYPVDEANWSPLLWTSNIFNPTGMFAAGKKTGRGASQAAGYLAKNYGGTVMGRMSSFGSWMGRGPARRVVRDAAKGVGRAGAWVGTKALSLGRTAKNQARTVTKQAKDKVSAQEASFRAMAAQCRTGGGCRGLRKSATTLDKYDRLLRAGAKLPGKGREKVVNFSGRKVKYWINAACNASKKCTMAHKRMIVKYAPMFVRNTVVSMTAVPHYDPYFGTGKSLVPGDTVKPIPIAGTDVELSLFVDRMW